MLGQVSITATSCYTGDVETKKRPTALQLSLQCDFRLEVVDKERLTGKYEEGSNLSQQSVALLRAQKTEASTQSEFCVRVQI